MAMAMDMAQHSKPVVLDRSLSKACCRVVLPGIAISGSSRQKDNSDKNGTGGCCEALPTRFKGSAVLKKPPNSLFPGQCQGRVGIAVVTRTRCPTAQSHTANPSIITNTVCSQRAAMFDEEGDHLLTCHAIRAL